MEVSGVFSRKELSKVSIEPMRACAMRYDRSSSKKGVSVARVIKQFHQPVYLGSSLSSLRRRNCTSGGISGVLSGFSSTSTAFSSSALSLPFSEASAGCTFSFGRGVPARLNFSSSSPITNSGSNSEGSGPFPVGAALALSPSLDRADRFEGERFRELDRRGVVELERGDVDCCAFCFACSSAMRALMAPPMRWYSVSLIVQTVSSYLTCRPENILIPKIS